MTEEQKQALTGLCNIEIKRWKAASESNPNMRYMVELMKFALTALTAQPVKLHDVYGYEHPEKEEPFYTLKKDEAIAAIRAAGYEVQE